MKNALFPIVVLGLCFVGGVSALHFAILNSAENISSMSIGTFEGVTLTMSAEGEVRLGENLIIKFGCRNESVDNVWLIGPSFFDVLDENRTMIGTWFLPEEMCYYWLPKEVKVKPGESYSENFVWDLTVYPTCPCFTSVSSCWPPYEPTELKPGTYYLLSSLSCRKNTVSVGIWLTLEITILPPLSE